MTAREELEAACREHEEHNWKCFPMEGGGIACYCDHATRVERLRLWAERLIAEAVERERDRVWQAALDVFTQGETIARSRLAVAWKRERLSVQGAPTEEQVEDGIIPLKDFPKWKERHVKAIRDSEKLTGEDLATRIGGAPTKEEP